MSLGLRVEDRLDGHTNYSVWKERMQSIFEEAEVWDIMVQPHRTLLLCLLMLLSWLIIIKRTKRVRD